MANVAWASGHILVRDATRRNVILNKIATLPIAPYQGPFSIWQGLFNAPEEPSRAGHIITFGLSHKYFGEPGQMEEFLDYWEEFISDLPAMEFFIAIEQEFVSSEDNFGKFFFQWNHSWSGKVEPSWIFQGRRPAWIKWNSRYPSKDAVS